MATRHPLPAATGSLITANALRAQGMHHDRLKRSDVVPVIRGFHTPAEEPLDVGSRARLSAQALPTCCVSHTTAARLLGLQLPWEASRDNAIHLTQPAGTTRRIRRPGIVSHRCALHDVEVMRQDGIWITTPARTWFDIAQMCSVAGLVQFGDQLVRIPRSTFEGRSEPHATPVDLQAVVERAGKVKGKRKTQQALELIRIGADSFPETQMRLEILYAGLPEPALQVPLNPADPASPCADAAYPEARIGLDYDGETHFTPEQWRKDQRRDNTFRSAGWLHLRFNREDAQENFRSAVRQVRQALRERGVL